MAVVAVRWIALVAVLLALFAAPSADAGCPFKAQGGMRQPRGRALLGEEADLFDEGAKCTTTPNLPERRAGVENLQASLDVFCANYNFSEGGDPAQGPACPVAAAQNLTLEEERCIVFDPDLSCAGPLGQLVGVWEGSYGKTATSVPAYNLYALINNFTSAQSFGNPETTGLGTVPGQPTSWFHTIKNQTYREIIVFEAIYGDVKNRGYSLADQVNAGCQSNEYFTGVTYKSAVYQTSPSDQDGPWNGLLHEEVGMILYNTRPGSTGLNAPYEVVRMASIPHGISLTATGRHGVTESEETLMKAQLDEDLNINPTTGTCGFGNDYSTRNLGWGPTADECGFPNGEQPYNDTMNMNQFLTNVTADTMETAELIQADALHFTQQIFSETPFLRAQSPSSNFSSTFWISNYLNTTSNETFLELQYAQKVDLHFVQKAECIECDGVTQYNANGCITACQGMDNYLYDGMMTYPNGTTANITGNLPACNATSWAGIPYNTCPDDLLNKTFNEISIEQHAQCYNCRPKTNFTEAPQCEGINALIAWPHIQVNTLRKISDDPGLGYILLAEEHLNPPNCSGWEPPHLLGGYLPGTPWGKKKK